MTEKSRGEKWRETMLAKHGSQEAISQIARENQKKSRQTYKGTGGFAALSPEARKEQARKAALKRWHGKEADETAA